MQGGGDDVRFAAAIPGSAGAYVRTGGGRVARVIPSIISQVTPSESSVIKRVAYEPLFLAHLRDDLSVKGVKRVAMHEPLTNIRKVLLVQFERGVPRTEIWRAITGAAMLQAAVGKYVIAIDEDIDPDNADAVFWAMAYRANPAHDIEIVPHRGRGHGPRAGARDDEEATLLIDATLKADMPPLALPKRELMEEARAIWESSGCPRSSRSRRGTATRLAIGTTPGTPRRRVRSPEITWRTAARPTSASGPA